LNKTKKHLIQTGAKNDASVSLMDTGLQGNAFDVLYI